MPSFLVEEIMKSWAMQALMDDYKCLRNRLEAEILGLAGYQNQESRRRKYLVAWCNQYNALVDILKVTRRFDFTADQLRSLLDDHMDDHIHPELCCKHGKMAMNPATARFQKYSLSPSNKTGHLASACQGLGTVKHCWDELQDFWFHLSISAGKVSISHVPMWNWMQLYSPRKLHFHWSSYSTIATITSIP
jgi:hypothetical protein